MRYKFFIIPIIILLFSCYTNKIILNKDKKSGQMIIEYSINYDYFELISILAENLNNENNKSDDEDSIKFNPTILIDKQLFINSFKETREVKLNSVSILSSNNIYTGKIVIEFSDFQKLMKKMPNGIMDISIIRAGNDLNYSQIINYNKIDPDGVFKGYVEELKKEDKNLYNKLTNNIKFNFIITTEDLIKKTEGVVSSGNNKNVIYSFDLNDYLSGKELKFSITL